MEAEHTFLVAELEDCRSVTRVKQGEVPGVIKVWTDYGQLSKSALSPEVIDVISKTDATIYCEESEPSIIEDDNDFTVVIR